MSSNLTRVILAVVTTLAVFAGAVPAFAHSLRLYVSTDGNDQWSGCVAAADPARGQGPFAALERARDELKRAGGLRRKEKQGQV